MHVDPPISLPPGTWLNSGRYRILHELNRGATAVVYAAQDAANPGQHVALKVMNCASQGASQVPVKVVKREIAFSTGVSHDNIVRLLDVFAEKTQLVIVWELISGPDLLDLLNEHQGCMPEPLAAFYFCQLLKGVMFMHDNGYCHRDIKPENAMVQRHNHQLKLIDFGLSKHLESARTRGVGTPDYLAPEMLQARRANGCEAFHVLRVWHVSCGGLLGGTAPYDARAVDAWAMGVLMYLLVTGKYPFEDPQHPNNLPYTIQNVLAGRMRPFPDHVSPGCRRLISNLLRIDPAQRTTLQALTCDEWLMRSAYSCAASLGRLDLLTGLQTATSQQPTTGGSGQLATNGAPALTPTAVAAAPAPADCYKPQYTGSTADGNAGAGPQHTTLTPMMTAASTMHSPAGSPYPAQQAPTLHSAVLQGWPTGRVITSQPANGLYPAGLSPTDEDAKKPRNTLWQRLKRKLG